MKAFYATPEYLQALRNIYASAHATANAQKLDANIVAYQQVERLLKDEMTAVSKALKAS